MPDQKAFAHRLRRKLCGARRWLCIVLAVLLTMPAMAQDKQPPRVLIIGDMIYSQHARGVTEALKGKANVEIASYPNDIVLNSASAVEHLDMLLGRVDRNANAVPKDRWPTWDMIHFNVGLGDLVYRVPGMESFRLLPIDAGGVIATDAQQYEKNLDVLVGAIKKQAPGAKLVWASTTPIRASTSNVYKVGSEVEYNQIAERVMRRHGIPVNDMHAYAKSIMDMDKPAGHGADPFNFDKKQIHPPIVQVIAKELKIKLPKPADEDEAGKKDGVAKRD